MSVSWRYFVLVERVGALWRIVASLKKRVAVSKY